MRYATALFELARDKGVLEVVEQDMARIAAELKESAVETYLFDARVGLEEKRSKLVALGAGMHELTRNFLKLICDKRRIEVLRELPAAFRRNVLDERGATEGVVESARPLGAGEMAELEVALGAKLGKKVELKGRVDPKLIAGVRVFVDNKLIDQSAAGRIEGLRTAMLGARLN